MFKNYFSKKEKGQGLVEYALVLVLVAVVVIAILTLLGPQIGNVFSKITSGLGVVDGGGGGGGGGPEPGVVSFTCPSTGSYVVDYWGGGSWVFIEQPTCTPGNEASYNLNSTGKPSGTTIVITETEHWTRVFEGPIP